MQKIRSNSDHETAHVCPIQENILYIPCQAYNRTGIGHVKDFITFETEIVLF